MAPQFKKFSKILYKLIYEKYKQNSTEEDNN